MQVTRWTWWSTDNHYPDVPNGMWEEARQVVVKALREHNYRFTGTYHQTGPCGCPIVDDKYAVRCSMRGWGKLMHEAYPHETESYLDYAWSYNGKPEILPKEET